MPSPRPSDPSASNLPGYLRPDLLRIWHTYDGLVPEAQLRAFIAAATGEAQPDRGPVTVVDGAERVFVYGADPCGGDVIVFATLANLEEWAPVNVAAEIAGTWGRFVELGGDLAASLRDDLAEAARFPDFEAYRAGAPDDQHVRRGADADDDGECPWAGDEDAEEAYADLDCPRTRAPLDDDELLRDDFITWSDEGRVAWFAPNRVDCDELPESIRRRFAEEFYDLMGSGPFVHYHARDEAAILAALARLGYTVVRDDGLIATFWGLETDLDGVVRRLAALRQADRLLAAAWGAVGDSEEEAEDD